MRKITSAEVAMSFVISTNAGKTLNPQWHGMVSYLTCTMICDDPIIADPCASTEMSF